MGASPISAALKNKPGGMMAERRNVVNFKEQAYDVATQAPSLTDESLADARRLRAWTTGAPTPP